MTDGFFQRFATSKFYFIYLTKFIENWNLYWNFIIQEFPKVPSALMPYAIMLTSLSIVVLSSYLTDKESIYIDKLDTKKNSIQEKMDKKYQKKK